MFCHHAVISRNFEVCYPHFNIIKWIATHEFPYTSRPIPGTQQLNASLMNRIPLWANVTQQPKLLKKLLNLRSIRIILVKVQHINTCSFIFNGTISEFIQFLYKSIMNLHYFTYVYMLGQLCCQHFLSPFENLSKLFFIENQCSAVLSKLNHILTWCRIVWTNFVIAKTVDIET